MDNLKKEFTLQVNVSKKRFNQIIISIMIAIGAIYVSVLVAGWFSMLAIRGIPKIYKYCELIYNLAGTITITNILGFGVLFFIAGIIVILYVSVFTLLAQWIVQKINDALKIYSYEMFVIDDNYKKIGKSFYIYGYRFLTEQELFNKISDTISEKFPDIADNIKLEVKKQ